MPMIKSRTRTGLLATAVAATLTVTVTGVAIAASGPVSDVRFVAHLNITDGQRPENITLEPDGSADVTFAFSRQVARITPMAKSTSWPPFRRPRPGPPPPS
ncbi:hypothetical protein SAZ11_03935 [Streptomyces sp. FXJ1.4098]|nr:hypothetical protein [Streptomyces sp. FXJ1.4098]